MPKVVGAQQSVRRRLGNGKEGRFGERVTCL